MLAATSPLSVRPAVNPEAQPVRVRRATVADLPRLAELSEQMGYPNAAEAMAARLARLDARGPAAVFVAEHDGRVAGWIHVGEHVTLEGDPASEIYGLVVDRDARRHGIARALVAAAERWAAARGFAILRVRSNIVRPDSHPFYEGVGFTRTKTQHVYQKKVGADE